MQHQREPHCLVRPPGDLRPRRARRRWQRCAPHARDVDTGALEKVIDEIVAKNDDKVADARTNPKAIGWFIGQVMKASGGKANPQAVNELLKAKLNI